MRFPKSAHTNRSWRIQEIARDFRLYDAWAFSVFLVLQKLGERGTQGVERRATGSEHGSLKRTRQGAVSSAVRPREASDGWPRSSRTRGLARALSGVNGRAHRVV